MATTNLQPRFIFGLNTTVKGNAVYISDEEIVYMVANALVVHNVSHNRQKLIRLPEKHHINLINIAPSKKYAAVADSGDKPTIIVYDLHTLKRKKALGIPYEAPGVTKFTCMNFTCDNKYIAAVTGDPDQVMLFYNWEKGKVESSIKLLNVQNPASIIDSVACNPSDPGIVAVAGSYAFKFLTVSETVWRPYGYSKCDTIVICSMTWLNSDRLLVGTTDGRILFMENGDLKNVFKASETTSMNMKIRVDVMLQSQGSHMNVNSKTSNEIDRHSWENDVVCLTAFSRGFVFGFGSGTVILFEKEDHKYSKRNMYVLPPQVSRPDTEDLYCITALNVNPGNDRLVVASGWTQLFGTKLWGPDLNSNPEAQMLVEVGSQLHNGPINGLSTCSWKSMLMTFGKFDRSVRLWDFKSEMLVLAKQYDQDICGISLHPTGLYCLVGFIDKLRFLSVLLDDLTTLHEFPIRNCSNVAFSHGGHRVAAVNESVIEIYSSMDFKNLFSLKGHTGKITEIRWTQNDLKLITIGSEGAIYEWNATNGHRTAEVVLKDMVLNSVAISSDGLKSYLVSSDKCIREIRDSAVARELKLQNLEPSQIVMGKDDSMMFIGCPEGYVLSMVLPLQDPPEFNEYHLHNTDISRMSIMNNQRILVTTGFDGSICFWKISVDGKLDQELKLFYTQEILIGKEELKEKVHLIKDLTVRIEEVENEHAYSMRQTQIQHNEKMKEIHQGYYEAIDELRNRIERLKEERNDEINTMNVEIAKMKEAHEEAMHQMETDYDAKLILEYDKYGDFEERNNKMREDYEKRLVELKEAGEAALETIISKFEAQIHEKGLQLEAAHEEMVHQVRLHESLKVQLEDDADREIIEIRTSYEALLFEERQNILKLKGESDVLRNKQVTCQRDVDEFKRQVTHLKTEQLQFRATIQDLEKDVAELKKEVADRDLVIQEREQRIQELKRTNQELEKFKFVLDYKIRELKNQIEPRDQEIKELKEKIKDMETELVNLHKTNQSLDLQLYEVREKLIAAKTNAKNEEERKKRCFMLLQKIRIDLLDTSELIQDPNALKRAVKKLYHRYSNYDEFLRTREADLDAQCEFLKQRNHLEKTVSSLQRQVLRHKSGETEHIERMMEENVILIKELNCLRTELKTARRRIHDMESLLGLAGRDPVEARAKLEKACHGNEQLEILYKTQMYECQRVIAVLKEDIQRLITKLPKDINTEEPNKSG